MALDEKTIDRIKLIEQATAIEAAGGDWNVRHVMAVLDCARSTVYETPFLVKIRRRVGRRSVRWNPKEVRAYQVIASGRDPLRATGS
jgi:hypothetical protein